MSPLRRVHFRLLAIVAGLTPFIVAEFCFRVAGLGEPHKYDDPFVGFASIRPLFELAEGAAEYQIPQGRQGYFRPQSFGKHKGENEFRVFCLGGSTVQGRPYATETAFPKWFELSLRAAAPHRRWHVINCGGISYASYRLLPILRELLQYEPDLVVLYAGHNEFLEARTYEHVRDVPDWALVTVEYAGRSNLFNATRDGLMRLFGAKSRTSQADGALLSAEVEALLDKRGGLDRYRHDPVWRRDVLRHFRSNLRKMADACQDAQVPLWIANPVSNLRGSPPFKSQHRDGLSDDELARWENMRAEASDAMHDLPRAISLLGEAAKIDDQFAALSYDIAQCYDGLGMYEQARSSYIDAKELDICPLRAPEEINQVVNQLAEDCDLRLIDVRGDFEGTSRGGIVGGQWMVDHVHPSIVGHQRIAELLMQASEKESLVELKSGWESARDQRYRAHLATLSDRYYLEGDQKLRNLRGWTHGRAGTPSHLLDEWSDAGSPDEQHQEVP